MKRQDSQLSRSKLPLFYKPKFMLLLLLIVLIIMLWTVYRHKDSVFQVLLLAILGAVLSLPGAKWGFQAIETCFREEKSVSSKNLRATAASKKGTKYFFIFFGIYVIIVVLGLIFPEKMSSLVLSESYLKMIQEIGNIASPYVTPPMPSPVICKFARSGDIIAGTSYYVFGGAIGSLLFLYFKIRKFSK